ncbi:ATP-binding protein [soil metagenome]
MISPYRRAYRPAERRVIGGVASGLAEHFGVKVIYVRLAFMIAVPFHGAGVLAYGLLWRFLPLSAPERSPGLEAADRTGFRPSSDPSPSSHEVVQTVALFALGGGALWLLQVQGWGIGWRLLGPLLIAGIGLALIWRQLDDATWSRWMFHSTGRASLIRLGLGVLLVGVSVVYFVGGERGWAGAADGVSAFGVALVGLALILGPWIYRLTNELTSERRERIRSQERADVAAHLHDSVLQTLALLQKNAKDPAVVATLARRQERELRDWLYGEEATDQTHLRAALQADAADVESMHHLPIEVVGVGDALLDDDTRALVRGAREAMVNAAKHSGADRIDVYAEVGAESVEVFVRDRGVGFDRAAVADDRMGIRNSIEARVVRHGGTVEVVTAPGEGTEVRMTMPLRRLDDSQGEKS